MGANESNLDKVIRDAEESLSRDDYEMVPVSLPRYVADSFHTTLLVLKTVPGIMDVIEGLNPALYVQRPEGLGADIITTLHERLTKAIKDSKDDVVHTQFSYAELFEYAEVLEKIGGTTAIEGSAYLKLVYESFVQSGGKEDEVMAKLISRMKEGRK